MFDRLGAETKADTAMGNKVSWKWGSHWGLGNSCLPWVLFLAFPTYISPCLTHLSRPSALLCTGGFPVCLLSRSLSRFPAPGVWQLMDAALGPLPPPCPQTVLSIFPQSKTSPGPCLGCPTVPTPGSLESDGAICPHLSATSPCLRRAVAS